MESFNVIDQLALFPPTLIYWTLSYQLWAPLHNCISSLVLPMSNVCISSQVLDDFTFGFFSAGLLRSEPTYPVLPLTGAKSSLFWQFSSSVQQCSAFTSAGAQTGEWGCPMHCALIIELKPFLEYPTRNVLSTGHCLALCIVRCTLCAEPCLECTVCFASALLSAASPPPSSQQKLKTATI